MKRPVLLSLLLLATVMLPMHAAHAADKAKPAAKVSAKPAAKAGDKTDKSAPVDSLAMLERATARDSSWNNLYRLGVMLLDHDRPQEAQRVLLLASKAKPASVPTIVNLGASYDALGLARQAQDSYQQALKLAPGDTVATCRLASSLYSTGDYNKSIDLLRALIAHNPNAYCAYFTLGVAFADAGIYRDAIRMWEKVVAIAPNSSEAMSAKESIDVLQRVLQNNPH